MSKKSLPPCKSVLITFHGDTTHATKLTGYDHDTRTKSACAKRNPADDYNAYEGARIALARLFGVNPFPEMENEEAEPEKKPLKFKTGARVRVVKARSNVGYDTGHVGTVTHPGHAGYAYGAYVNFDHNRETHFCYRDELELIDDAVKEEPKVAAANGKVIKDFEVKVTVTPIYEEDNA